MLSFEVAWADAEKFSPSFSKFSWIYINFFSVELAWRQIPPQKTRIMLLRRKYCSIDDTNPKVTGCHSQGLPLPGCVYEHMMLFWRSRPTYGQCTGSCVRLKYRPIFAMLFCWNIYGRCCFAWVYNYVRCCSAGIYRPKSDAVSGDPKPTLILTLNCPHNP